MGRAVRVFLTLGAALVVALFLCTVDEPVSQEPPREPRSDPVGEGRTRLNGEPREVQTSHLLKEAMKPRQGSDITGNIISSTMRRLFNPSHSRQRRATMFAKTVSVHFIGRAPNPLREDPPASPISMPTNSTTMTPDESTDVLESRDYEKIPSTTKEPTVVTVTEVLVTESFEKRNNSLGNARVVVIFEDLQDMKRDPVVAETLLGSSLAARPAATLLLWLVTCSCALALPKLVFSG
ncbi:uncharacterized protein LOC132196857 [Neocloeon triangulifer]|uniref:uncharacterized protein LOC132196857 n=1 Tax=Neocloeon triangulifer TaxID=2078957 RepID=UPI00286F636F|nr:uncharacterized protein LOC132196857 [Neocloeon triangulifer]